MAAQPLSGPQGLPVLEYQSSALVAESRWRRVPFVLVAIPVAASPFFTFAFGTSPLDLVKSFIEGERSGLLILAAPFFLGPVILAWQVRVLVQPDNTRAERVIARIMAIGFASLTTWPFIYGVWLGTGSAKDYFIVSIGPMVFCGGIGLLIFARSASLPRYIAPIIWLEIGYMGNALMCLVGFYSSDPDLGWKLTAVGSAGIGAELLLIAIAAFNRRRFDGGVAIR